MKSGKLVAFQWMGGKHFDLPFIIPLMPRNHNHFVDVFGGAAHVIMNVPPAPLMTYNDIDEELVNFFTTLRNNREELIESLLLTPYSRSEFAQAIAAMNDELSDVERARCFYTRARQAVGGMGGGQRLTRRMWGKIIDHPINSQVSRWINGINDLHIVADVFASIQIECDPAINIIKSFDHESVFFYCDPPYVQDTRSNPFFYKNEMSDDDHREIAAALSKCKARAMVSGYPSELYNEIYKDWLRVDAPPKAEFSSNNRHNRIATRRQQSVWVNYKPPEAALARQETLISINEDTL